MATTVNVNSEFKGIDAGLILGQIFKESTTIKNNLLRVIPNVVGSTFIQKTYLSDGLADYSCGFNPSGVLNLSEVELTPKKLKFEIEICKEVFRQRWAASQMGFSAWNDNIPATEQEALVLELDNTISNKIDSNIWVGSGTQSGEFEGLIRMFKADATVVNVASTPSTVSNVQAELGKALDAVSDEVLSRQDFVFGVSSNIYRNYVRSLSATNSNFQADVTHFDGYKLILINKLPANTMVLYPADMVFFGTGLEADMQEVRIKDMDESDLSGQIRIKMVFTAGVKYVDGSDVVLYSA